MTRRYIDADLPCVSDDRPSRAELAAERDSEKYDEGYSDGKDAGYDEGYTEGYIDGHRDGRNEGHERGVEEGRREGADEMEEHVRDVCARHTEPRPKWSVRDVIDTVYESAYGRGEERGITDGRAQMHAEVMAALWAMRAEMAEDGDTAALETIGSVLAGIAALADDAEVAGE